MLAPHGLAGEYDFVCAGAITARSQMLHNDAVDAGTGSRIKGGGVARSAVGERRIRCEAAPSKLSIMLGTKENPAKAGLSLLHLAVLLTAGIGGDLGPSSSPCALVALRSRMVQRSSAIKPLGLVIIALRGNLTRASGYKGEA